MFQFETLLLIFVFHNETFAVIYLTLRGSNVQSKCMFPNNPYPKNTTKVYFWEALWSGACSWYGIREMPVEENNTALQLS
jgi:hypothetical protein